jgi:hypothetical protein
MIIRSSQLNTLNVIAILSDDKKIHQDSVLLSVHHVIKNIDFQSRNALFYIKAFKKLHEELTEHLQFEYYVGSG